MAKAKKMAKTTKKTKTMSSTKSVKGKKVSTKKSNESALEQSLNMNMKQRGYVFLLLGVITGAASVMMMNYAALPYFTALLIAVGLAFLAKSYALSDNDL